MTTAKEALQKKANQANALSAGDQMRAMLLKMSDEIKRALPDNLKSERFQRVALTAFNNNPALQKCDPVSFLAAMMQSAQLGLEPNTPLGQAYLIPYGNKVQFQLGYKGLIDLAMRTGQYESIYAHEVYEKDDFEVDYGLDQKLIHKPLLQGDRGKVIGYYAVYKLINGGYGLQYMSKDDVDRHRNKYSKAANSAAWNDSYDAMAKKTVIKQALKYAPLSIELQKATSIDERVIASAAVQEDPEGNNYIEASWESPAEQGAFLGDDFVPLNESEM